MAAFAVLRGVAAHEAKACREWGYPKESKWQKDEDNMTTRVIEASSLSAT